MIMITRVTIMNPRWQTAKTSLTLTGYLFSSRDSRTAAQRKYDEVQKQRQLERVMKKAEKTHKERVEDFNRHLDELSEHYDIPKVSWTK